MPTLEYYKKLNKQLIKKENLNMIFIILDFIFLQY